LKIFIRTEEILSYKRSENPKWLIQPSLNIYYVTFTKDLPNWNNQNPKMGSGVKSETGKRCAQRTTNLLQEF
jgi:hypothetical protein